MKVALPLLARMPPAYVPSSCPCAHPSHPCASPLLGSVYVPACKKSRGVGQLPGSTQRRLSGLTCAPHPRKQTPVPQSLRPPPCPPPFSAGPAHGTGARAGITAIHATAALHALLGGRTGSQESICLGLHYTLLINNSCIPLVKSLISLFLPFLSLYFFSLSSGKVNLNFPPGSIMLKEIHPILTAFCPWNMPLSRI